MAPPQTHILAVFLFITVLLGLPPLAAQSGQTPGTSPTANTGQSPTRQISPDYMRDLIISGNVVMADGSPPPEPVAIQLVCASNTERVADTDGKGFFSFQLAQQLLRMQDTGENSNLYPGRLMPPSVLTGPQPTSSVNPLSMLLSCEFHGYLAGFRSTSVTIPTMEPQNPMNIGTIILLSAAKQRADVSATNMKAPPRARKAYEKASAHLRKRDLSSAQRELEHAVKLYPQYVAAWTDLGRLHAQQNRLDQAREAFLQAREADEKFVPAYLGLASVAVRQSNWAEAQELSSRATQLDGAEFPVGFYYNAVANFRLGQLDNAEKSARAAARFDTRLLPQVKLLLGSILGARKDYAAAADEFKTYLRLVPSAANADRVRQHIAELEKLATASVQPSAPQDAAATAVAPETKLELAVSTNWETGDDMGATSNIAGTALSPNWAPPDIDEVVPPVSPGIPCPSDQVVNGVSLRAKQLMDNLQQFSATERIEHVKVDKSGNAGRPTTATAKYVAVIQEVKASRELDIYEYRDGTSSSQSFPANLATTGIAAHALMFHPTLVDNLTITCEGLGNVHGQPAWQLHFAQRPDRPARFRRFITPRGSFDVPLKGRAWAAVDNYQVMRMESDLAKPINAIALRKDHIIIDYRPVEFRKLNVQLWLPETADLYLDFLGHRSHRQHSFSDFELFWVETAATTQLR